ncbi:MAG: hypothetical protein AMXMBFR82_41400 [Candidatus Hydrogenedentota bacterium]
MPTTPKHTTLGTPCARSWTNDWIATVDATESERNHRICGARLPDGTPCCNESGHPSGRCPFHGGFDLTGAPQGNRNHVIHGLYSRRLRPCTQTCPHWQTCPVANRHTRPGEFGKHGDPATHPDRHPRENGDPSSDFSDPTDRSDPSDSSLQTTAYRLKTSSIPQSAARNPQFPTCPYQLAEYNTVLTDALAIVESQPHPNPMGIHTAHNVATLQVLVSTAASQLAQAPNLWTSEDPNPDHPNPTPHTPNPSMVLAFTRLMREFRHSLKLLHAPGLTPLNRHNSMGAPPTAEGILRHAERSKHDTGLDPDSLDAAQLQPQTPETHAKAFVQQAALAGGQGRDVEMCEAFDNAALLDEPYAESERGHVLASYRPARHSVSEELAEAILGHLHIEPPTSNGKGQPMPNEHAPNTTAPSNGQTSTDEPDDILQYYLDLIRDGKMPPEAFPIGSPFRAQAETKNAGPPTAATSQSLGEERPATREFRDKGGPVPA